MAIPRPGDKYGAPSRPPSVNINLDDEIQAEETYRGVAKNIPKYLLFAGGAFVGLYVIFGSFYTVQPNEMAGVRRFGTVVTPQPVGPGFHLKLPFIDRIDRLSVSQMQFKMDNLTVNTVDNQPVVLDFGVTYRIPPESVLRLLYKTGESGSADVTHLFGRIIADRIAKVFAQENTVTVSADRDRLHDQIRVLLVSDMRELFGIDILDVQIADIRYSDSFVASVNAAVQAKNAAVAAENNVNRVKYEADQAREKAAGEADAAVRMAQGHKDASVLAAEGEARALQLKGDANAKAILAQATALASNPLYVQYVTATTWNGQLPTTMLGNATPLLNLNK